MAAPGALNRTVAAPRRLRELPREARPWDAQAGCLSALAGLRLGPGCKKVLAIIAIVIIVIIAIFSFVVGVLASRRPCCASGSAVSL